MPVPGILKIFKTITADNGSEFANLSKLEEKGIGIYFTHPYTSCEKGTVECHNWILRRFIPKGKSIDDYTADQILIFADFINGLPRKILNYHTPDELFEKELDRIYACDWWGSGAPRAERSSHSSLRSSFDLRSAFYCEIFVNYCNLLLQFAKMKKRKTCQKEKKGV